LGDGVVLNFEVLIDGRHHNVYLGNNVSIGPQVSILTLGHDPQSPTFGNQGGEVRVKDRVWIGFGATILPGVTIGEGAVVAARSVVSRDVDAFSIVAGVPAKEIGQRNRELTYELSYDPWLG
jgi:maltose O-acetyltransferase